jgi:hypothetical protein
MPNVTHNSLLCIYFNSLHVSSTLCSSSWETNCINTASGICHSVSVTVSSAGRKFRGDTARTVSIYFCVVLCIVFLCCSMYCFFVLFYVLFVFFLSFCVLFVCKCVLYYCHRVTTQLQLINISYTRGCIDTICLSWWWAQCARNM